MRHDSFCCADMLREATRKCDAVGDQPYHVYRSSCPDCVIAYYPPSDAPDEPQRKRDVFGLMIHDGGDAFYAIRFCPWCGSKI